MNKIQLGQTLIEALIALAVAGIVIAAGAILTQKSLSNSQTSKNQNLATQYAQEGLEIARLDRTEPGADVTYCVAEGVESLDNAQVGVCVYPVILQEYKREVSLSRIVPTSSCGGTTYQVKSVVSWQDAECKGADKFCRKVELITCLAPN